MKHLRRWIGVGLLLFAGGTIGMVILDRGLEAMLKTSVDRYLSARTLTLMHAANASGLTIALPSVELGLLRRRLVLRDVRIRYDRKSPEGYVRFEASAPSIVLSGLDLSDLFWHRNFRLSRVRITEPTIRRVEEEAADTTKDRLPDLVTPEDTIAALFPAPDSLLYQVVANWLPDDVRGGRVENVTVEHATVVSRIRRGAGTTSDSTSDLSLVMEGLQLDSTEHRVFEHGTLTLAALQHRAEPSGDSIVVTAATATVGAEDTSYTVGLARFAPAGQRHGLAIFGFSRSQARQSLTIDSVIYGPHAGDSTYFRGATRRTTRVRLRAAGIAVHALRQGEISQRRVTPASITIEQLEIDVLANQRPPAGTPVERVHWPARFASLGWTVGADTIRITSGSIRYAELRLGAARTPAVEFDSLDATITNATNDTSRAGNGTPMVLSARTLIYGQGRLQTRIAVPVRPGPLHAQVSGHLGGMAIEAFDRFVLPASGFDITSGTLHGADFDYQLTGGRATGTFSASYEQFDLSVVDKATGKQNFGKRLKTLFAGMMVRGSNLPDDQGKVRTARISYDGEPGDSFWGLIWRSLRSGIVKEMKN